MTKMNWTTLGLGIFCTAIGISATYLRLFNSTKLAKMEAINRLLGNKVSAFLHITAYSVLPTVIGVILIMRGVKGIAVFSS